MSTGVTLGPAFGEVWCCGEEEVVRQEGGGSWWWRGVLNDCIFAPERHTLTAQILFLSNKNLARVQFGNQPCTEKGF